MANNNDHTSTVIVNTVTTADLGRTHGSWDYVILPEASQIIDRGQVIVIYGSGNNQDPDLNRYSLTTTKDGGTISIGGNYYQVRDLQKLYMEDETATDLDEDTWEILLNKTYSIFSSFTTQLDLNYFNDYIDQNGKIIDGAWLGNGKSPSQYNIYHLSVNDNVVSGALRFTGESGNLVLTAQNGSKYSQYYDSRSNVRPEYYFKQDDGIALRSDNYGFTTRYIIFRKNDRKDVTEVPIWPGYDYDPFNYEDATVSRPAQTIVNYTINAENTLNVVSDLAGKIQSNTAAFISSYCVRYDTQSKEYIWDLDTSNYTIVNAGVKADTLVLESNFRAQMTSVNNSALFEAKFDKLVGIKGINEFWNMYDPTVAYGDLKEPERKNFPYNPALEYGGYISDGSLVDINVRAMEISATSVGGGNKADNVKIETHGIYVNNLQTSSRVGKWVANEYKDDEYELEYVSRQDTNWAGKIIAETSNALIMADTRYLGYISAKKFEEVQKATATVNNSSIGAYGVRADGTLHIASMGSISLDKDNVLQTVDYIQSPSITVTASNNTIYAYNLGEGRSQLKDSTVTASALYADTIYLGASRIADENGGYLKDKSGKELVLNTGGVSSDTRLTVTAYNNTFDTQEVDPDAKVSWNLSHYSDYQLEYVYGIYAENGYFGGFDGTITINSDHDWATGIHVDNLYSVDSLGGVIEGAAFGINSTSLTVKGVIDTEIKHVGMGINIQSGGQMDIDAFTGEIFATEHGINIYKSAQDITNIAGSIIGYGGSTFVGVSSFEALNLRISGTIDAPDGYAVLGEAHRVTDRATGLWGIYRDVTNESLRNDYVELSATAKVNGVIELGGGSNTLRVNSSAEFAGYFSTEMGTLNLVFDLDEKTTSQPTMIVSAINTHDATLGDTATITINLNYAVEGTYTLLQYEFDARRFWSNKTELIALRYQDETKQVELKSDGNGNATGKVMLDNGAEVTLNFIYDDDAEVSALTVDVAGNLVKAPKISTQTTVDEFVNDLVYAENEHITLKWETLDRYIKEQLDAGVLQDDKGTKFNQFTGYQVVYALRDKDGKQIGRLYTVDVSSEDDPEIVLSLNNLAMLTGVNASDISAAKIINITAIGKDEKGKNIDVSFAFSQFTSEFEEEKHLMSFDWSKQSEDWNNLLKARMLRNDNNNDTFFEIASYNVTFEFYTKLGLRIDYTYTQEGIEPNYSGCDIDLRAVAEASDGKINSWTDIGYVVMSNIEIVGSSRNGSKLTANRKFSYISEAVKNAQGDDKTIALDWSVQAGDWSSLLDQGELRDQVNNSVFEEITGYKLYLSLISSISHSELELPKAVEYKVDAGTVSTAISLKELLKDNELALDLNNIESIAIKSIEVLGKSELLDENGKNILDESGNPVYQDVSNSYSYTEHNSKSELRAEGIVFNWSIMDEDIESQIAKGELLSIEGISFPDVATHTNKYDVTFNVYAKDGSLLGKPIVRTNIENYKVSLTFREIADELNIAPEDIANVKIGNISAKVTYIEDGAEKEFVMAYNYPETTNASFCNNITASWTVEELKAKAAGNQGQGMDPASITQCEISYVVKNKQGVVIGTISGVKTDVENAAVDHDINLTEIAEQLNVDINDIGSVEVLNVTALGMQTEFEVSNPGIECNELTPAAPVWVLDWSALSDAITNKGEDEKLDFFSEIVTPSQFEIKYHVEFADGRAPSSPGIIKVECSVKNYELTWDYLVDNLFGRGADIDIEAIADAAGVGLNQAVTIVIDEFKVKGSNGNGTYRTETLAGMANDVKVINATNAETADIVKLDCTEFEQYLNGGDDKQVADDEKFTSVTYTYKLYNAEGEVLGIKDSGGNHTQTVTFDSSEGKLYLKDNEYLLEDYGEPDSEGFFRTENDNVSSLTIESLKVGEKTYNTLIYDKFQRKTAVEWEAFAGDAATYIAGYVVVDKSGKRYYTGTVEGTGTSAEIINLDYIAKQNKVGVETLAVELVSVKVKIDDPANGCDVAWKAVSDTNRSDVASTVVTFNLYRENGDKLGELTETFSGPFDNGTLDLDAWATANGKAVADIKQIEFKSVEYKGDNETVLESALGIGEQSLPGPYCTLDWSKLVGNAPDGWTEYTVTYEISGTNKKEGSITVKKGDVDTKQYQLAMGAGDKEVSISKIEYKFESAAPKTVDLSSSTIRYHVEWDVEGEPLAQTEISVYFVDKDNKVIGGVYEKTLTNAVEDCYITQEEIDDFARLNSISDSEKAKIVGVQLKSAVNSDPAQPEQVKTAGTYIYAITGEGETRELAAGWQASLQTIYDGATWKEGEEHKLTYQYILRDKDGNVIGDPVNLDVTIPASGKTAKEVFDALKVDNLDGKAAELVLIDVVANSGIDITEHPAGPDGKSHLGDYVTNGALYFDFEDFDFQEGDEITLKLYDAEGKQVGNEIVATYKAEESFWTAVNDDYVESGATTVVIDEVTRNGQAVYEKETKSALLYHDIWLDKLTAAPADGAEYTVTYVFRDKDGNVVGSKTADYQYDGSKTSAADFNGLSDDEKAKVTQIQILKVEDKSVPGMFVYDITDDDIFMDIIWDAEDPAGVTVTSYDVIFVLKDARGDILHWYTEEGLPEKFLRFNISNAVENDLSGRTEEDVASVEIVAVEVNGKDVSGNDIEVIYAGFESKAKVEDSNKEIIKLDWSAWYSNVYSNEKRYKLDDSEYFFQITYQAVDDLSMPVGGEQTIILKTTFQNYCVDKEQLAAKLSEQLDKTVAIADICEVQLKKIEVLDDDLSTVVHTYTGFQQSVSTRFKTVGYQLDWSTEHQEFMADIADDHKLNDKNFASFDHYEIEYAIKDASGTIIYTGSQKIEDGSSSYFVDTIAIPDASSVEITKLTIFGKEGVYTDVDLNKEFTAGNLVVLDWSKESGVNNSPTSKQKYNLKLTLTDNNGSSRIINIENLSGRSYTVDLAQLAAEYGFNANAVTKVSFDELVIIEDNVLKPAVEINKTTILNCGENAVLLDWSQQKNELEQKIQGGLLKNGNGETITGIDYYKINYAVLDQSGNRIGDVREATVTEGSSYIVPLDEPGATSAILTKIEIFDSAGNSYSYSWTEAVSVVGHFVENYNEFEKTLTISWYGLDSADYNLDMISQYEIEYKLLDEDGKALGESIAVKCPGNVMEYTINGIEHNINVEWRIRVLGDPSNGRVSAWSNWHSVELENMDQNSELFDVSAFSSSVLDANPSKDTTGVVNSVAQLSWDGISSKHGIRNYVIEYCELGEQIRLNEIAPGVALKDFVASNDGNGLFQIATDDNGNIKYDQYGNEYTVAEYGEKDGKPLTVEVYTKTFTGENLSISELQNQSYVYWRIKAVDAENNESQWLAGNTFRVWIEQDHGKPQFTNYKSGTVDINFPSMAVLAPDKAVNKDASDVVTTYEAILGWNSAFDTESGVQAYVIKMKGNDGHEISFEINAEEHIAYSCAQWTSSDLEIDGIYAVRIMDNAGNWVKLKDVNGVDQDYLTDVRLQKYNDTSFTLSWYTQTDFTGMNAAVYKKNPETGDWEAVLGYQDEAKLRPVLVDNMIYNRYDYTYKVDGLKDQNYDYWIAAKDYFGNITAQNQSASGELVADSSNPSFSDNDRAMFRVDEYIADEDTTKPVLLKGALLWTAASDSESQVRKYIVRFKAGNSTSYANIDEFSALELQDRKTTLDFSNVKGLNIEQGNTYQITVNGQSLGSVEAEEDGVLRLDSYIANITSVTVKDKVSVYHIDMDNLGIGVFEMQTTEITGLEGAYTGYCTVDFGDGTTPVENVVAKDGVIFVDRNVMYGNTVTVKAADGTELFAGRVTEANGTLFYRMDSSELKESLKATGYRYEIIAVDYFGKESRVVSGAIEADMEAPVFNEAEIQTAVSGFEFIIPTALPDTEGITASYSAWLGWVAANDGNGTGVRAYTVEFSEDDGKSWQSIHIAPADFAGISTATWTSEDLVDGKLYSVYIGRNDVQNVRAVGNTITWTVQSNLKGMTVGIYEADSNINNKEDLTLIAEVKGVQAPEKPNNDQYSYTFVSGKTFESWTLASGGSEGSLNASDVYKVTVDNKECKTAMREINGKVLLTWVVDGNDNAGHVKISKQNPDGSFAEVFDSQRDANSEKFAFNREYYECVYELPGISSEEILYRISAEDFCNNSTADNGTSLAGSLVVDSGLPKFSNVEVDSGELIEDANSNKKMTPSFSWAPATDAQGDLGIWYYELYIDDEKYTTVLDKDLKAWYNNNSGEAFYTVPKDKALECKQHSYKIVAYDYFGNKKSYDGSFGSDDITPPKGRFIDIPEGTSNAQVTARWETVNALIGYEEDAEGNKVEVRENRRGKLIDAEVKLFWKWEQDPTSDDYEKGVYYCVTVDNGGEGDSKISYDFWTLGKTETINGEEYTTITFDNSTPGRSVGIFEGWSTVNWSVQVFDKAYNGGAKVTDANLKSQTYTFKFKAEDQFGETVSVKNYVEWTDEGLQQPLTRVGMVNKPEIVDVTYVWDEDVVAEYAWSAKPVNTRRDSTATISWTHEDEVLGVYSYIVTLDNGVNKFEASTIAANVKGAETDMASMVKFDNGKNQFTITDLREFFNLYGKTPLHDIPDGNYKLTVTACDTNGRKLKSNARNVVIDTTVPQRIENNDLEVKIIADNVGNEKYIIPVVQWKSPAEDVVSYEVWYCYADIETPDISDWFMKSVKEADRDKKTGLLAVELPSVSQSTAYKFHIVAIDALGNRSQVSDEYKTTTDVKDSIDTVLEALTPVKLASGEDFYPAQVVWSENNRFTMQESVGYRDEGDTFVIRETKSCAVTLTISDLNLVLGKTDDLKIEVYKVNKETGKAKSWKVFSVKDNGRVVNELLLDADTFYAFRVVASDYKNSVPEYKLTVDKKDIGGAGNDNTDDTLANILDILENNPQEIEKYSVKLSESAGQAASDGNWVGYGDFSDIKILSFKTTGRYTFSLSDVAAQAVLTVYEVVKKTNAKGEVVTSYKKVTSVTANQTKLDGVTSKEVVLEAGKEYFYEVKIGNKKLVGTEYKVTVNCIDSYPGATEYDNLLTADKTQFADRTLELDKELTKDKDNADLWVGAGDKVDYFMLTDDSGKELKPEELYQLKLDGIEGNNIKVAIGYLDAKGQFKAVMSKTGAKNAEALIMHCNFTYEHLSKGQLYVQVSANGKNGNSRYSLSMTPYSKIQGRDNTDDTAEVTQKNLKEKVIHRDWVGFGDNTDFVKLELTVDGLYQFTVSKVANNVTVDVLKKVTAANGAISYVKVDTLKATASKNAVDGKLLMLDASEEYYVSVTAPGANKGNNSDYELIMSMLGQAVNLGSDEFINSYEKDHDVSIEGTVAKNYVYTAAELGGAYEFTLDNTDATGSVKLTVYELLDNGKKRTVKSITVKAGEQGSTGYLWLDDDVVKNGTGIYQVEIKGTGKKVEGNVEYSVNGYGFAQYLEDKVADNNLLNDVAQGEKKANKDWVGMGDASDSYKYTVNNVGVHEFTLEGINGNNIKLTIMDSRGKVLKKFTGANKADFASFAYEFKATGEYTILVEAAGKNKFSEYTLSAYDRVADAAKLDDTTAMLGNAKAWDKDDESKLVLVKDEDPANAVDRDVEGWVGAGDAKDFYGIVINASGNYDLNISNLDNNVKVTLYEATAWNTFDNSIKSGKAVKSVTATADGFASLSGFYLDANKNYYVVVQATSTNGSKNSEYKLDLKATAEIDETKEETGTVTKTDPDAYTFTATNGAYDVTLTLEDGDKAVVTLYKVNPANGKYVKVKSVTATSKNATVNTGDLSLEAGFSYVVEVTAPNAKNGAEVGYRLSLNNWSFQSAAATTGNNRNDNDLANATLLTFDGNTAKSSSDAVWRVGKDKTAWDAVDYYKVEVSESGAYSLKLDGINGNTVKVTIGTLTDKGKFKAVQSVTGKAGSTELLLSRELDANTYYVKVESVKNDTGSEYTLELTNNEKRVGFSNENDTWKQVAGDIDSVAFYPSGNNINDWVGFGDAVDVFKIRLEDIADRYDDNSQVVFRGSNEDTANALIDKEIKLSLVDANGKSVALTFDKESGRYTSKNILMAGADYYLTVKNSNAKKQNIDYDIDISLA